MNEKTRVLNRENIDDPDYLEGGLYAAARILGHLMKLSHTNHGEFLGELLREQRSDQFKDGMVMVLKEVEKALPYQIPRKE